jgi:hypothetical protein
VRCVGRGPAADNMRVGEVKALPGPREDQPERLLLTAVSRLRAMKKSAQRGNHSWDFAPRHLYASAWVDHNQC